MGYHWIQACRQGGEKENYAKESERNAGNRRGEEVQERGGENKAEEEGEEYMSEGEDGRPCIKWRRKEIGRRSKEKTVYMRRRGGRIPV